MKIDSYERKWDMKRFIKYLKLPLLIFIVLFMLRFIYGMWMIDKDISVTSFACAAILGFNLFLICLIEEMDSL